MSPTMKKHGVYVTPSA